MNWSVFHCTSKLILSNQLLIRLGRVIFLLKITESGRVGIQRRSDRPSRTSIVCAKAAVCVRTCHTVSSKTIEQQPRVPFCPFHPLLFHSYRFLKFCFKIENYERNFPHGLAIFLKITRFDVIWKCYTISAFSSPF